MHTTSELDLHFTMFIKIEVVGALLEDGVGKMCPRL